MSDTLTLTDDEMETRFAAGSVDATPRAQGGDDADAADADGSDGDASDAADGDAADSSDTTDADGTDA